MTSILYQDFNIWTKIWCIVYNSKYRMDILRDIIYHQNAELLQRISDDMYNDEEDKQDFIDKYHKKNFSILIQVKRNNTDKQLKIIKHCVK